MPPEIWRTVQRLLVWHLVCSPSSDEEIRAIQPALQALQQTLFTAQITLLSLNCQPGSPLFQGLYQLQLNVFDAYTFNSSTFPSIFNPAIPKDTHKQPLSNLEDIVNTLRLSSFDAAIILTTPLQSPFTAGYLCYLAGIPVRVGQSREFGGAVLSHCITPSADSVTLADHHLHLLKNVGLVSSLEQNSVFISP